MAWTSARKAAALFRVCSFGLIQGRLRLVDNPLAAFALLLPGGLFPCLFALMARFFPFVSKSGFLLGGFVWGTGRVLLRFFRDSTCGRPFRLSAAA